MDKRDNISSVNIIGDLRLCDPNDMVFAEDILIVGLKGFSRIPNVLRVEL